MTRVRTASFLWFLAHDLRLSVRAFNAQFRGLSRVRIIAILLGAVVLAHALAWPAARQLQFAVHDLGGREHIEAWVAAGVVVSSDHDPRSGDGERHAHALRARRF